MALTASHLKVEAWVQGLNLCGLEQFIGTRNVTRNPNIWMYSALGIVTMERVLG